MAERSPKSLNELIAGLDDFKTAYLAYLEGGRHGDDELRQRVHEAMPAAQRALNAAKMNLVVADPPALGAHRQSYTGLATLAFLHERPGWGSQICRAVIDNVDGARAKLADMRAQELRRRRNPLFWIDRGLRALLMIPAYIVGLIVGESAVKIDRSAWGLPLRLLAIVADAFGVYGAGRAFGWW